MKADEFKARFGEPVNDDLERVNCEQAGEIGHQQCGMCSVHDKPRFMCGCVNNDPCALGHE